VTPGRSPRWLAYLLGALAVAGVLWLVRTAQQPRPGPAQRSPGVSALPGAPPPPAPPTPPAPRNPRAFASRARLEEHYSKHGREFGQVGIEEYLRLAQALRDAQVGGDIEEIRRDNGDVARFDRASGAFGVFEADGTIRTFFRPRDGGAYFRRQARRHN